MELLTYGPPEPLRRFVDYFWRFRSCEDGVFSLKLFGTGVSGIIVQGHNSRTALTRTGPRQVSPADDIPNAFVYGKRTHPGQLVARAPFELTGVVLRPQALYTLLRIDPADVKLAELEGGLSGRAAHQPAGDPLVGQSLRILQARVRTIRLPQLRKCVGLSERQFERRFQRAVGVPPHLRILRFQEGRDADGGSF